MKNKPTDIRYSPAHTWARLETNNKAIIGITDYSINNWTDIIAIRLPEKNQKINLDQPLGEIESEDNILTVISPVNGKVLSKNNDLFKNKNLILDEPYDDGWLLKIQITDPAELDSLLTRIEYENIIENEDDEQEIFDELFDENE